MKPVVLITGCSSGFGYGAALKFARAGYQTYATARNLTRPGIRSLRQIKKKESLPLEVLQLDVTDGTSIAQTVRTIYRHDHHIDILINNAGFGYLGPIEDFTIAEIQTLYDTNIYGVIRMVKAVAPVMRQQQHGLIINLSSINGIVPFPLFSIYSSTKYAIETLTEGWRFELSHFGIKVVLVEPGSFGTNFARNRKQPRALNRKSSPYRELVDHFQDRYQQTHKQNDQSLFSKTADPQQVVETLFQIAQTPQPKLRYRIGNDAHKFYLLRKLLPYSVWEWLLHRTYRW